ncbi:meiosis-specific nuclear structural protein 1-like isoform X3 [Daktulosphaira vitifoliae]|uniref:meiosis-specific nuclear structural protein 1-like isoform X3 n=1 Tax=Daktulosphaira vitifoliae TaxID=58002 RepID=UPI0021A9EC8D|nr:meiosis-specific nuclear structural protein 1-like isoform X3 [Daktulosphaira vitifoliae]
MELVYIGNRKCYKNRVLVVSSKEWKRLTNIVRKNAHEQDAAENSSQLKENRQKLTKNLIGSWNNTVLNETKRVLEQKHKAKENLEVEQRQIDEQMKIEAHRIRNEVIEKTRKLKFEEKDWTKTFNRALQQSEVFKERNIQLTFNELERLKKLKENLSAADERSRELKKYNADMKKLKYQIFKNKMMKNEELLKEMKLREENKQIEKMALYNSNKLELQKLTEEIKENENSTMLKLKKNKELHLKTLQEKIAAKSSKKNISGDSNLLKCINEQEKRFQEEQRYKKEKFNKRNEDMDNFKKINENEKLKNELRLITDCQKEMDRYKRTMKILYEYKKYCRKIQADKIIKLKRELDEQCVDKVTTHLKDKEADIERSAMYEKLCNTENEEFVDYALKTIEKCTKEGKPIIPLLKALEEYLKKNNLYIDEASHRVLRIQPKAHVRTSRVIHESFNI